MPNLLFCVGKAVADVGLVELAAVADGNPLVAAGLVAKVAAAAWKEWREDKKQDKLNADVLDAAKKSFEEAKQAATDVAKQVTPDPELQGYVERFVTLVPASIRATLRRPEDPTGTSVPKHFAIHDPDDLVKLLPARLPRFKAGDTPPFLRGWRLVEQIGAGGFGEVWKAQNTRAGNLVNAVKFGHGLSDAEQTLLNEGDVLNRILAEGHHDGIVKLLDVWADGDAVPWLRYEYIAGGDLTAQVHQWQRLPAEQRIDRVLYALTQIAGTVGHFHTLNPFIVHRDLKPSNILYDPVAKRFKVADFGIGGVSSRRMLSADSSMSLTAGAVVASYLRGSHTPLYASPQQRAGSKLLDPRDDVHALGVIAYQMVTGQLDAAPGSDAEHDLEDAGVPPGLISLVRSCTANKPDRRPRNAVEVVERLKALARLTPHPPEPTVPTTFPTRGEVGVAGVSPSVAEAEKPTPTSPLVGEVGTRSVPGGGSVLPLVPLIGTEPKLVLPTAKPIRKAGDRFDLELPGGLKMAFAWCPPGKFMMGCPRTESGRVDADTLPRQMEVSHGVYAGVHPVTVEQFSEFVRMTGYKTEAERHGGSVWNKGTFEYVRDTSWRTPGFRQTDTHPVTLISWDDAVVFCGWLGKYVNRFVRLPSEVEWEYMARGGTWTPFYWGTELNGTQANCHGHYPYGMNTRGPFIASTSPVGWYAPDYPHPWGLTDVIGNVCEWCDGGFDQEYYSRHPTNPERYDTAPRMRYLRGGSWLSDAKGCRAGTNTWHEACHSKANDGFRVVFNAD